MTKLGKYIELKLNEEKLAMGIIISNYFNWLNFGLLKYDKETETILLNEAMLMTIIKMINPAQKDRKIKVLPENEWIDFK